ncbi:GNAT family N-acetyltransferase [Amycolatopsis japonica]|uniref:GNAT family N-acetyltransferase n=1 Tax=Amycolatopsis japonica TaxID=208439 RepID=UPI00331F19DD
MRFAELTDETWPLFERLFGPGGVQGGCWCAFFRLTGPEFKQAGKDGRKAYVRDEVAAGKPLGLLALADDEPVGWVAVSPRLDNPRLAKSPVAASPGDHTGVWSVTCFYIGRKSRRQGLSAALLRAAVGFAAGRGPVPRHGERFREGGFRTRRTSPAVSGLDALSGIRRRERRSALRS